MMTEQSEPTELQPVYGFAAQVFIQVGDGDFTVTAPWLGAAETFSAVESAEELQAHLRAEGPPDDYLMRKVLYDQVTGFAGRATAVTRYLCGPRRVLLEAVMSNGVTETWFDIGRLTDDPPQD